MSIYSDRHMIFVTPHDKLTIEQELAESPSHCRNLAKH